MTGLGIVIIGRNEGERLTRCLEAVRLAGCPIVYVDSASTDGSVAAAGARGIPVLVLDPERTMNAARARNEGLAWLLERHPGLRLVQFVDGDTTLDPDWLATATSAFSGNARLGIAAGHLGEQDASRSVLHLLAALEWRKDPGEVASTGGIFMGRVEALAAAGGFDAGFAAGEEADLCTRVHASGFAVMHLDAPMGTHDIGELGLRSWWLRCVRTGHSYAQAYASGRNRREARSALGWALVLPVVAIGLAWVTRGASLLLLPGYLLHGVRVHRWARHRGWTERESVVYGAFTTIAKFPEAAGILRYFGERMRGVQPRLVRYR